MSRAVLVTVVVPTGNAKPLAGTLTMLLNTQLSVAVTLNVTLLVQAPGGAFTVILAGQLITGGMLSEGVLSMTTASLPRTTTRSSRLSPLNSPAAIEAGLATVLELTGASKVPSPLPESTETLVERSLATARSKRPSRLKSPATTARGP